MDNLATFKGFADRLTDIAGGIARRYFRTSIPVDIKPDESPVTRADREIEAALREAIQRQYPDHGILGEEHGTHNVDAEYLWVIDPIDGTKSFITGRPLFGTLIALLRRGMPVLGLIDQPVSRERWVGVAGAPSTLNGDKIRTRPCSALAQATLTCTSPHMFNKNELAAFEALRSKARYAVYGSDCYAYGLLASGFIDILMEADLKPYDYCALIPIVEGAGGVITDWQGHPLGLSSDGRVLACGDKRLHKALLALISSAYA